MMGLKETKLFWLKIVVKSINKLSSEKKLKGKRFSVYYFISSECGPGAASPAVRTCGGQKEGRVARWITESLCSV